MRLHCTGCTRVRHATISVLCSVSSLLGTLPISARSLYPCTAPLQSHSSFLLSFLKSIPIQKLVIVRARLYSRQFDMDITLYVSCVALPDCFGRLFVSANKVTRTLLRIPNRAVMMIRFLIDFRVRLLYHRRVPCQKFVLGLRRVSFNVAHHAEYGFRARTAHPDERAQLFVFILKQNL